LKETKKPAYYCLFCAAKALKDGTVYTEGVASVKRLGMTEHEAMTLRDKKLRNT